MKKRKIHRLPKYPIRVNRELQPGLYLWKNWLDDLDIFRWDGTIVEVCDNHFASYNKTFSSKHQAVNWLRGKFPYGARVGMTKICSPAELIYVAGRQGITLTMEEARRLFASCCDWGMKDLYYEGSKISIEENDCRPLHSYSATQLLKDEFEWEIGILEDCIAEKDSIKKEAEEQGKDMKDIAEELADYDASISRYQKTVDILKNAMERNHLVLYGNGEVNEDDHTEDIPDAV